MASSTEAQRTIATGVAMGVDISLNYPLWIAAKRLGVGLTAFPSSVREIYRGGGSLWLSLAPTVIVEDKVTRIMQENLSPTTPLHGLWCAASSGAVAAACVTSQVEHVITAAHTKSLPIHETVRKLWQQRGPFSLLIPPGIGMMMGREIPFAASLFWLQPNLKQIIQNVWPTKENNQEDKTCFMSPSNLLKCAITGFGTSVIATPISHVPSVVAAYQQGHGLGVHKAIQELLAVGGPRELWRGLVARTLSLAGTLTVVPIVLDALAPRDELKDNQ